MAPREKKSRSEKQNWKERRQDNKPRALPARLPHPGRLKMTGASGNLDRFGIIKFGFHRSRRLIALVRFSLHRMKDDLLQFFGDLRIDFARCSRVTRDS